MKPHICSMVLFILYNSVWVNLLAAWAGLKLQTAADYKTLTGTRVRHLKEAVDSIAFLTCISNKDVF